MQESRYDAIASGRLRWEARPKNGTPPLRNNLRDPYFDWTLAGNKKSFGRSVILQRASATTGTIRRDETCVVKLAQVRIYGSAHHMLEFFAADLAVDLQFYKKIYGSCACGDAFVAMRFERPDEATL